MTSRHWSPVSSSTAPKIPRPALFTRQSIRPSVPERLLDEAVHGPLIPHVHGAAGDRGPEALPQLPLGRLDRVRAAAAEADPPALAEQGLRDSSADPAAPAGDDRDLSRAVCHGVLLVVLPWRGLYQGGITTWMSPVLMGGKGKDHAMMHFDPIYFLFVLPALALSLWASWRTHSTFKKYSKVRTLRGLTGAQAAQEMLRGAGIYRRPGGADARVPVGPLQPGEQDAGAVRGDVRVQLGGGRRRRLPRGGPRDPARGRATSPCGCARPWCRRRTSARPAATS